MDWSLKRRGLLALLETLAIVGVSLVAVLMIAVAWAMIVEALV